MWTLTFELHTGPVVEGHDQRPDTRPIEVPACKEPLEESPRKTGVIHTRSEFAGQFFRLCHPTSVC